MLDAAGPPADVWFVPLPTPLALCDSGIALPERLAREAACGAGFDGAGEIPENGVGVKVSPITTLPLPIVTPPHETALPVTAAGIPLMSTVAEPAAMARGWGGCLGLECGASAGPRLSMISPLESNRIKSPKTAYPVLRQSHPAAQQGYRSKNATQFPVQRLYIE